uniref:Uncharacterized protein n=1 Tax=Acrobeloides nanus TaxID=290746 RepID=A0A914CBZ3_9BILA
MMKTYPTGKSIINIKNIPRTQYLKAIDEWILAVGATSFITLFQVVFETEHKITRPKKYHHEESEEKTYWISERPYYAQLPEGPYQAIKNDIAS